MKLRVGYWPRQGDTDQCGTILLFPGRTEYVEKYGLTARDLTAIGYDVITLDWRGQGLSQRLKWRPNLGHVGDFAEYQLDVAAMLEVAKNLELPHPFTLLTHSMGGAIGLRALHEGLDVAGACFSAPMWGIKLSNALRMTAWTLSYVLHKTPLKTMRAPGAEHKSILLTDPFEGNMLTIDSLAWTYMADQAKSHPELTLGGPTIGWVYAALYECRRLAPMPAPLAPAITWLGSQERIIEVDIIREKMENWPNGRLEVALGHEHELLLSPPRLRGHIYDAINELSQAARR